MSNNLNLSQVAAAQLQKETTINDQSAKIDAAVTETLDVDYTAGNVTLTDAQFREFFEFNSTNLSVARSLTVPAIKRFFFVNNTGGTDTLTVTRGSTTIALLTTENGLFYTDGSANGLVQAAGGAGGGASAFLGLSDTPGSYASGDAGKSVNVNGAENALEFLAIPYDIGGFFGGTPSTTTVIMRFLVVRAFTLPSGMTGSQGHATTGPSAQTDFDIQQDGVSKGTMRFAMSATTATFIMASPTVFAAGERLDVVTPADLNSMADISWTFAGTR